MNETDAKASADAALEILDAMAETWAEKHGIAQVVFSIPVNCPTPEFHDRARALILRHIKLAYVEGLYAGRRSAGGDTAAATAERP